MRLIEADALLKELRKSCKYHAENSRELSLLQRDIIIVQEQPTIDAVPVVRCKDCKHWYEKYRHGVDMSACKRAIGYFGANDYCSRAERKEEP